MVKYHKHKRLHVVVFRFSLNIESKWQLMLLVGIPFRYNIFQMADITAKCHPDQDIHLRFAYIVGCDKYLHRLNPFLSYHPR